MISETTSAARSEAGMLNQTPSAPNQIGRMARKGNRKISCRESDSENGYDLLGVHFVVPFVISSLVVSR